MRNTAIPKRTMYPATVMDQLEKDLMIQLCLAAGKLSMFIIVHLCTCEEGLLFFLPSQK